MIDTNEVDLKEKLNRKISPSPRASLYGDSSYQSKSGNVSATKRTHDLNEYDNISS